MLISNVTRLSKQRMYELELEESDGILCATVHGELDPITDLAIDRQLRRECENRGKELLLIDIRPMVGRLSGIDNHIAAKTFQERMGADIRAVAIVDTEEYMEKSEMFEITALNRGAEVKFFLGYEEAKKWLIDSLR